MKYIVLSTLFITSVFSSTINLDSISQYLNSQKSSQHSLTMSYKKGKWQNPFKQIVSSTNNKIKEMIKYDELKKTYSNFSQNTDNTGTNLLFKINLNF